MCSSDLRPSRRHRLEGDEPEAFQQGRDDDDVGRGERLLHQPLPSPEKMDSGLQIQRVGEALQRGAQRTIADDQQSNVALRMSQVRI